MSRHKFEKKIVKYRVQKPEVEKAEAEKPLPAREAAYPQGAARSSGCTRSSSVPRS